jgi:hypothetical protein
MEREITVRPSFYKEVEFSNIITVKNPNYGAFLHNTKAIAHAVATYATSFASLPPKAKRVVKKAEAGIQYKGPVALW